ncbi:MAG TPA: DUF882 domain-containing protein, partial [Halioglobus sp.]
MSEKMNSGDNINTARRRLLRVSCAAAVLSMAPLSRAWAINERRLALHSLHTGEQINQPYWIQGNYVPESLSAINRVLRDHRNGDVHPIDTGLLDQLSALQQRVGSRQVYDVISGYRSPASNAMLHNASSGVAERSLHLVGQAIDIRLPGTPLTELHRAAREMKAGGVGLYTAS